MIYRSSCLALLALTLFVGSACALSSQDTPTLSRQTMGFAGEERGYYLHVPAKVTRSGAKVPLVIALHGGGGNGKIHAMMTGFTAKAEREGFIVVYPDGSGGLGDMLLTWNSGHCCAFALEHKTDDAGYIRALLDKLVLEQPIDPRRVYVTGLSNGGMMSHYLGIAMGDRIAAIAPVISGLFGDELRPATPVPTIIINGGVDNAVKVDGGPLGGGKRARNAADAPLKPVAYQGEYWAAANGCQGSPQPEQVSAQVTRWRYACPAGQEVERYLVLDNGHAWPSGRPGRRQADHPSMSLDATDVIWDFFKRHQR